MKPQCLLPCSIDRAVAKELNISDADAAHLRAAYIQNNDESLSSISLDFNDDAINSFNKMSKDEKRAYITSIINEYEKWKGSTDYREKGERLEALQNSVDYLFDNIAEVMSHTSEATFDKFSKAIQAIFFETVEKIYEENNGNLTKAEIINGVHKGGSFMYGQFYLFEQCRNKIEKLANSSQTSDSDAKVYKKLLNGDIWNFSVALARRGLANMEDDFNLGDVRVSRNQAYDDSDVAESVNIEESVKEGWQVVAAMIDSYKSAPREVKKVIQTIIWESLKGDYLNASSTVSAVDVFHDLVRTCRGCTNSDAFLEKIKVNASVGKLHMKSLSSLLEASDRLKTLFYKACKKGRVLYSKIYNKNGRLKSYILNKVEGLNSSKFYMQTKLKTRPAVYYGNIAPNLEDIPYIINEDGSINIENIKTVKKLIDDTFVREDGGTFINKETIDKNLVKLFSSFGIHIDYALAHAIAQSSYMFSLASSFKDAADIKKYSANNASLLFENNLGIRNLFTSVEEFVGSEYKDTANVKNNKGKTVTMRSAVNPSYLTTMVDTIKNFIETKNKEELKKYLESLFLESSQFSIKNDDNNIIIFNRWLRDIYDTYCSEDSNFDKPFNNIFTITRDMNYNDGVFENCTPMQHIIMQLAQYNHFNNEDNKKIKYVTRSQYEKLAAEKNLDKKCLYNIIGENTQYYYTGKWNTRVPEDYANYPLFTLGDNGGSYYIKQRQYDESEIIDGIMDLIQSEIEEISSHEELLEYLNQEGQKTIDNRHTDLTRFNLCLFLNPDFQLPGQPIGKYAKIALQNTDPSNTNIVDFILHSKEQDSTFSDNLRDAVREYIKDSFQIYMNKLEEDGLFNIGTDGKYENIDGFIKNTLTHDEYRNLFGNLSDATYAVEDTERINAINKIINSVENPNERKALEQERSDLRKKVAEAKNKFEEQRKELRQAAVMEIFKNFYINQKFANMQQAQITFVSPGYLKNSEDYQKRYKAFMANGIPLDTSAKWDGESIWEEGEEPGIEVCKYITDPISSAEKTNPEFADAIAYQYGIATEEFKRRTKGKNLTYSESREIAIECGKKLGVYKKYTENPTADGQGWRSLKGYRRVMIMSAQWNNDMEDLYRDILEYRKIQNKKSEEAIEKLHSIQSRSIVFQPIKPLLQDIETVELPSGRKVKVPVFHKYAEIPIIPEFLPEGSYLKHMAEYMEENKVDMIGVWSQGGDKIVKVGGFGSVDITNSINAGTKESLEEDLNSAYTHKLHYSNYLIQNNVPEHINVARALGTQIRKLMMSGLSKEKLYDYFGENVKFLLDKDGNPSKLTGSTLLCLYNACIVANMLESNQELDEIMNNEELFRKKLFESAYQNGSQLLQQMYQYASKNEDGEFNFSLNDPLLEHDAMSMAFSLFRSIVNKQQMPGGSAVQASSFGIKDYSESGDLQYIKDEDENILYAQCEMPWDLYYLDENGNRIDLDFHTYCYDNGELIRDSDGISKLEKEFPGILDVIAYRVPTEREYSMMNLKIKRFTPKVAGGIIKVPTPSITTAGFDFDIDKLYLIRKDLKLLPRNINNQKVWEEIYAKERHKGQSWYTALSDKREEMQGSKGAELYNYLDDIGIDIDKEQLFAKYATKLYPKEFEKYNPNKLPIDNSKVSRNNLIFDIMWNRLSDPETFERRTIPGGFDGAKNVAKLMREIYNGDASSSESLDDVKSRMSQKGYVDKKINYDITDPYTQVLYNQQNQVAAKVIGIFANHNANYAFSSLASVVELEEPIAFGQYATSGKADLLNADDFNKISSTMAEFLASSVDAVKDPVLKYLNITDLTANSAALLARLGYSLEDIGLLLNQPVILKVCKLAQEEQISLDTAINYVLEEYDKVKESNSPLDTNSLYKNIVLSKEGKENSESQKSALLLFSKVTAQASKFSEFIGILRNTASNSIKSSYGDFYAQQLNRDKFLNNFSQYGIKFKKGSVLENSEDLPIDLGMEGVLYKDDKFSKENMHEYSKQVMFNPYAYEQAMFDLYNIFATKLLSKYVPYENFAYVNIRDMANSLVKYGSLSADLINQLHSEIPVFLLSTNVEMYPMFDANADSGYTAVDEGGRTVSLSNVEFYKNKFPTILFSIVNSEQFKKEFPALSTYLSITDNAITVQHKGSSISEMQSEFSKLNEWGSEEGLFTGYYYDYVENENDLTKEKLEFKIEELTGVDIAEAIFLYNFYTNGLSISPVGCTSIIPASFKESFEIGRDPNYPDEDYGITYSEFISSINSGMIDLENFNSNLMLRMFMLNHSSNKKISYTPFGKAKQHIDNQINNQKHSDYFVVDISKGENYEFLVGTPETSYTKDIIQASYVPLIKLGNDIYIACNKYENSQEDLDNIENENPIEEGFNESNMTFNTKNAHYSDPTKMVYVKVPALGVDKLSISYNSKNSNIDNNEEHPESGENVNDLGIDNNNIKTNNTQIEEEIKHLKEIVGIHMEESKMLEFINKLKNNGIEDVFAIMEARISRGEVVAVYDANGNETRLC